MTDKLIELREKMANLATNARSEYDKITDKTSESEAKEIEARFDAMMADHDKIASQVEREERLQAAEAQARAAKRPVEDSVAEAEARSKTPEYREVFEKQLRFGVGALDSEERGILNSGRAAETRAQSVGTDSAGGYTVPEGFANEIDKAMAMWGPMWDAAIVRELPTATGNPLPWPTVDDTSQTASIKSENAAATDDGSKDVTFAEKVLGAYMYNTGIVRIPMELLQDSYFNMEALLTDLFGERMGRTANAALTTGTGSSQPNGIVTAASLGKTADSATAITFDEIIDLFHSVDPAYRQSPKCRFQMNDSTLAAVRKLKDGQNNYLWQMGDIRTGEPDTILGKPYSVNQAMADIGASASPIIFGDHSRYVVRKVRDFSVMTLRERYAEYQQIGMMGFSRFDGELINTAAVKKMTMAAS